jgi:hypothetical protein
MKHKLLYLFVLSGMLATGCVKSVKQAPALPTPSGTFTGQFIFLHRHTNSKPFDTVKTNIIIKFVTPDFTFSVTPSDTTIHKPSHGVFGVNSPYLIFSDKTYIATSPPAVPHLNGYYLYNYDGTTLKMLAYSLDTLALEYNLTKTGD